MSSDSSDWLEEEVNSRFLEESVLKRWILLDGNRLGIAGGLSAGVFALCLVLATQGLVPTTSANPVVTTTTTIAGGLLPFITIVMALNQLVISQELGSLPDLRERMDEMREFRMDIEEPGRGISPRSPADFLIFMLEILRNHATTLQDQCEESSDDRFRHTVDSYVDTMTHQIDGVTGTLEDAGFGTFEALSAILDYNTSAQLYGARYIQNEYCEEISADIGDLFDDIVADLEEIDIARQFFKTQYIEYELAKLSRWLLYAGLPAFVWGITILLIYDTLPGLLSQTALTVLISVTVAILFAPFAVLFAYTLRIATVMTRTTDFGPFSGQGRMSADRRER